MAITRLTDIITVFDSKWTYGDTKFGYEGEVNQDHDTQYPLMLIQPPESIIPAIYDGREEYSFEINFYNLYKQAAQSVITLQNRWDNLQDLSNEWLDLVLKNYQDVTVEVYLNDESIEIERVKDVANDKLVQIKLVFTMSAFTKCFRPVSKYPTDFSGLKSWLRADSELTFDIPTRKVSVIGDSSGNSNGASQSSSSAQPERYSYGGGTLDKTMLTFKDNILNSQNNFTTTPLSSTEDIINGDMELNSDWLESGSVTGVAQTSDESSSGTYSFKYTITGNNGGIKQTNVPLEEGKTYAVSWDIFVPIGSPDHHNVVVFTNTSNTVTGQVYMDGNANGKGFKNAVDGEWKTSTVYVKANAGATSGEIRFTVGSLYTSNTTYYLDNVSVKQVVEEFSIFEVSKINAANDAVFGYFNLTDGSLIQMGTNSSSNYEVSVSDGTTTLTKNTGTVNTDAYHIASLRKTGETIDFNFYNPLNSIASSNTNTNFSVETSFEQKQFRLGATKQSDGLTPPSEVNTKNLDGDWQELIIYDRKLTDAETAEVVGYLNKKYKIY